MKQSTVALCAVLSVVCVSFCLCAGVVAYSLTGAVKQIEQRKPQPKADPALQAARSKVLESLMLPGGPFEKIDKRGLWVRPAFYAMPFDRKQEAVSVAWCWAFEIHPTEPLNFTDNAGQVLSVLDTRTGKDVGRHTYTGLKLE